MSRGKKVAIFLGMLLFGVFLVLAIALIPWEALNSKYEEELQVDFIMEKIEIQKGKEPELIFYVKPVNVPEGAKVWAYFSGGYFGNSYYERYYGDTICFNFAIDPDTYSENEHLSLSIFPPHEYDPVDKEVLGRECNPEDKKLLDAVGKRGRGFAGEYAVTEYDNITKRIITKIRCYVHLSIPLTRQGPTRPDIYYYMDALWDRYEKVYGLGSERATRATLEATAKKYNITTNQALEIYQSLRAKRLRRTLSSYEQQYFLEGDEPYFPSYTITGEVKVLAKRKGY